jgi:Sec-independent protein translocase protein TatA
MFGFSLAELFLVLLAILIFIKPQDLPEIARFVGKAIYHGKRLYQKLKNSLTDLEKEFELDSIRHEVNQAIASEKLKHEDNEEDATIIVDMFGNEHRVNNIKEIRSDLDEEKIKKEVEEGNAINKLKLEEVAEGNAINQLKLDKKN